MVSAQFLNGPRKRVKFRDENTLYAIMNIDPDGVDCAIPIELLSLNVNLKKKQTNKYGLFFTEN